MRCLLIKVSQSDFLLSKLNGKQLKMIKTKRNRRVRRKATKMVDRRVWDLGADQGKMERKF